MTTIRNFIEQASACEQLSITLGESSDITLNKTLCEQLHARLAQLKPGLLDPIPPDLTDDFTVNTLPAESPHFDADCTELCNYCMVLSAVLGKYELDAETEHTLRDLLCGLTGYFVEEMMAPRWVKGVEGVDEIKYA